MEKNDWGQEFNELESFDFVDLLRGEIRKNPNLRVKIVADWAGVDKLRAAKALLDMHKDRLHIDEFVIRASRSQYEEDMNAFASGVKWEEIVL